ncbi:hypothetical protein ASPWEDRAFT_284987 [Aspergillus wentii DTO 134E9]|uniref:Uncharacterized protein n=1 Tax=Aspergillus wentii DTO 134E9 TaxID=1073089 RepID=A0A1L9S3L5_ASPWE|nr:uncharacterized protein ASPWEDRAFT_284987 [Aspergillus wentii DTO 134E9]KAI9930086.1 hypothetical protein MW887_011896 [Aspergillus wentii]OJJ41749.1 hypothetical protein ASPWEDRAFT_284987 [Aspergillus wentii DTO 134E9]
MGVLSTLWSSCIHPRKQNHRQNQQQAKEPPPSSSFTASTRPLPPIPASALPQKPRKLVKKASQTASIRIVESPEPEARPESEHEHESESPSDEKVAVPSSHVSDEKHKLEISCEEVPDRKDDSESESPKHIADEKVFHDAAAADNKELSRVPSESTLTVESESLPPIEEDDDEGPAITSEEQKFINGTDDERDSEVAKKTSSEVQVQEKSISQSTTPELKQSELEDTTKKMILPAAKKDSKSIAKARMTRRKSLIEMVNLVQSGTPGLRFPLSTRLSISPSSSTSTGISTTTTIVDENTATQSEKKARRELSVRVGGESGEESHDGESLFRS